MYSIGGTGSGEACHFSLLLSDPLKDSSQTVLQSAAATDKPIEQDLNIDTSARRHLTRTRGVRLGIDQPSSIIGIGVSRDHDGSWAGFPPFTLRIRH